jgi:ribosomal subunit interface protein
MDILVHAEGFRLDETMREAVGDKIGHTASVHAPKAVRARVNLRRVSAHPSQRQFKASVLIEVPGVDLSAEESAEQPMAAVDLLVEKIERRLSRRKTARLARRNKAARASQASLA